MPLTKKRTQYKKSNKRQRQGKRNTKRQNTRKKLKHRRQRRKRLRGGGGEVDHTILANNDNDETSQIDELLKKNDTKIGDMVNIHKPATSQQHSLYTIVQGDNGIKKLKHIMDSGKNGRLYIDKSKK